MSDKVVFEADSYINHWTCGQFTGHAMRDEPRAARWCQHTHEILPARPARWRVTVDGVDRGWCEVIIPLAKGRQMRHAVALAVGMFASPEDIRPVDGRFGRVVEWSPSAK